MPRPSRRFVLQSAAGLALLPPGRPATAQAAAAPARPSERQLRWHARRASGFVHFGINTFTGREWGRGDEPPALFDPTDFDAAQIVRCAAGAGLRGIVLTAKHHDGFCLWPTRTTERSVANSPWRGGRGDVVRELAQACAHAGLAFGVYLSPWDRHHPDYGRPAYVDCFHEQLRELLTGYGTLSEVWFDAANGGNGWYGGADETRHIDPATYYDWPTTFALVRALQPDAVIFGQRGADLRWVGNERGEAGDPCRATVDDASFSVARHLHGVRGGALWRPAECDVPMRRGWFWRAQDDLDVKQAGRLTEIAFASVGRGAGLLLGLAPDRSGQIPDADARTLLAFGQRWRAMMATDLARDARATVADQADVADAEHGPARAIDGRADTWWAAPDGALAPTLELVLRRPARFDVLHLEEYLPLGQRIGVFAVDAWRDGRWREIATGEAVGACKLLRLPAPVTAGRVRLRILDADAPPALSLFALRRLPPRAPAPTITRGRDGRLRIDGGSADARVHFTLDGREPASGSTRLVAPIALPEGGLVRAARFDAAGAAPGDVATRRFGIAPQGWRVVRASAPGADVLVDEGATAPWRSPAAASVEIDLGRLRRVTGFLLEPAQAPPPDAGPPAGFTLESSADGQDWQVVARGEFANVVNNPVQQYVDFPAVPARRLRWTFDRAAGADASAAIVLSRLGVLVR